MYRPYPGGTQKPGPSPVPEPPTIASAVRLMYAGASASFIGIIVDVVSAGSVRAQIAKLAPNLTSAQVSSTERVMVMFLILNGLIAVGAWIWLATASRSGKGWARTLATVLFGLDTIFAFLGFAHGATLSSVYGVLVWLIGLAVIALLWQRPSSAYFQGHRQR